MNWEAIGAIGEIVGAGAVVLSLLYLAAQIRQNSRIVRGTSVQSIAHTIQAELRWSGDYGEIFVKMIEAPESLTKVEAFKLGEWMTAAMWARQNEYVQFRQKLIGEDVWHGCRGILKNMFSIPWVRRWWANFDRTAFTSEFIDLVSKVEAEVMAADQPFDYQAYVNNIDGSTQAAMNESTQAPRR